MKKFFALFLCVALCLISTACSVDNETPPTTSNTEATTNSTVTLLDQDDIKISYKGTSPDLGVGEGIYLLVENSRAESIIVNIAEVSLNDTMQAVIQPQMPLNIISAGKNATQTFVFSGTKDLTGKAQFKIKILDENYSELLVSDFVEISF